MSPPSLAIPFERVSDSSARYRWRPVVIMAFPHYTTKEERYKDYV